MVPKVQQGWGRGTGGQGTGCILPWEGSAGGPRGGAAPLALSWTPSQMSASSPVSRIPPGPAGESRKAELGQDSSGPSHPGALNSFREIISSPGC